MRHETYTLILQSAQLENILPLLSACNLSCRFCSHRNNPPWLETHWIPPLSWEQIQETVPYLSPRKPIWIGESATRIIEGEPLLHPLALESLELLRRRFPHTPLRLTTNGILLSPPLLRRLEALAPLELTVSLNALSPQRRQWLLGPRAGDGQRILESLGGTTLPFHGSLVALPQWGEDGWEDLRQSLVGLSQAGAQSIRLLRPGASALAPLDLLQAVDQEDLTRHLKAWQKQLPTPILLEPAHLQDWRAQIAGVLPGSPAHLAGLKQGMMIESIGGKAPRSRQEAWEILTREKNPVLYVNDLEISLTKEARTPSGAIFYSDLSGARLDGLMRAIGRASNPLLLTSSLALPLMEDLGRQLRDQGVDLRVSGVKQPVLGGSIRAAGLLLVQDWLKTAQEALAQSPADLILLPEEPFDAFGRDLAGISVHRIQEVTGVSVWWG